MKLRITLGVLAAAILAPWVGNTSLLARPEGRLTILSHRGVYQTYPPEGVDDATCTATRIRPPTHRFIENTLPSIGRAFELGADMVEIDVHPTTDGEFAVFHDWTLECRTNGRGVTREHSLAQLKALDVGYGYTADGGKSFPLRGQPPGMIPSLAEVLAAFPAGRFMVNVKSNDAAEGETLAAYLAKLGAAAEHRVVVFGGWKPVGRVRALNPDVRAFDKGQFKDCALGYLATGWFGRVPGECRGILVFVPQKQAWMFWGWPNRFLARMQAAGAEVYIAGDAQLTGRQTLHGLDDPERAAQIPPDWKGGVSTDRIDLVGPVLKPQN